MQTFNTIDSVHTVLVVSSQIHRYKYAIKLLFIHNEPSYVFQR